VPPFTLITAERAAVPPQYATTTAYVPAVATFTPLNFSVLPFPT